MANIEKYEGFPITFENKNGKMMVNATQMAKPFEGKTVSHWLSNNRTTELIACKSADSGIPTSETRRCRKRRRSRSDMAHGFTKTSRYHLLSGYLQSSTCGATADSGIPTSELVVAVKGGEPSLQGTWLHEDLALPFAQWLSVNSKQNPHETINGSVGVHVWVNSAL